MGIVFFCQSCGARFEADERMAGKRGRCKKCGQMMVIPKAEHIASMVGMPALVGAGAGGGGGTATATATAPPRTVKRQAREGTPDVEGPPVEAWIGAASTDVGLAPLTVDQMPSPFGKQGVSQRKAVDDDLGDSKPYLMAEPEPVARGRRVRPVSGVGMLYQKELAAVSKVLRWINDAAYLLSVPFLMIFLLGTLTRSRPLALLGATIVVLLNLGRVVTGVANLVVVPFREGVTQGLLFLVPPFTFIYLNRHWNKLRKPTMRVVGPALTIFAVVAAFAFVPSLSKGAKPSGTVVERLEAGASALGSGIKEEIGEAKDLNVDSVKKSASASLQAIKEKAKADVEKGPEADPAVDGMPAPEKGKPGPLKKLENRVNDFLDHPDGKP